MPKLVVNGAELKCDKGSSPGSLTVRPDQGASSDEQPGATVADHVPSLNIPKFGLCKAPSNPEVAAATAAAQGVLTPRPCIPITILPWSPGSSLVTIDGSKALTNDSTCRCTWTGTISVTDPGASTEID